MAITFPFLRCRNKVPTAQADRGSTPDSLCFNAQNDREKWSSCASFFADFIFLD